MSSSIEIVAPGSKLDQFLILVEQQTIKACYWVRVNIQQLVEK